MLIPEDFILFEGCANAAAQRRHLAQTINVDVHRPAENQCPGEARPDGQTAVYFCHRLTYGLWRAPPLGLVWF